MAINPTINADANAPAVTEMLVRFAVSSHTWDFDDTHHTTDGRADKTARAWALAMDVAQRADWRFFLAQGHPC